MHTGKRIPAQVLAAELYQVERVAEHARVVASVTDAVERGDPVVATRHRLAASGYYVSFRQLRTLAAISSPAPVLLGLSVRAYLSSMDSAGFEATPHDTHLILSCRHQLSNIPLLWCGGSYVRGAPEYLRRSNMSDEHIGGHQLVLQEASGSSI